MKLTFWGGIFLVTGFFLFIFKAVASFMKREFDLADLTLEKVLHPDSLDWMETLSWEWSRVAAEQAVTVPLYLGCILFGVFFLILGGIWGK